MSNILKTVDHVGGIEINVYRSSEELTASSPIALVFLLHGRFGSTTSVDQVAKILVEQAISDKTKHAKSLWVVTFDHRNHGTRLVNPQANNAWDKDKEKDNVRHAVDMYAIQTGTARDVSFLIDFLPAYLFPDETHKIEQWGVAGISLGGHSTWITLSQDSRVTVGIPIIGCPDYLPLITERAKGNQIPVSAPHFPPSLLDLINESDPASAPYSSLELHNPFLGKKVLVLSGASDKLVPWSASEHFVQDLQVGHTGVKRIHLYEGVGHECTPEMVQDAYLFIAETMLADDSSNIS